MRHNSHHTHPSFFDFVDPFKIVRKGISNIMSDAIMMTTKPQDERLERKCTDAVGKLVDLKINFLAIDFDQTMIDIHTGGRWKESVSSLTAHLRPLFLHLIPIASSSNIRIAIVTFSPQTKHIREVLEYAFPPDVAERIPIRGNDGSWTYVGNGMKMGKQEHMASAAEELMAKQPLMMMMSGGGGKEDDDGGGTIISKSTTLLIDDDPTNIKKSLKDGTRAVWLNPRDPLRLLDDIMRLK
mmetsp:Transcript_23943/g.51770  ORF Transcript_23943/g.51770 Transcript_23943/m.51770 type:complete len:240 (+) Transcript_23943:164-883(+)